MKTVFYMKDGSKVTIKGSPLVQTKGSGEEKYYDVTDRSSKRLGQFLVKDVKAWSRK